MAPNVTRSAGALKRTEKGIAVFIGELYSEDDQMRDDEANEWH